MKNLVRLTTGLLLACAVTLTASSAQDQSRGSASLATGLSLFANGPAPENRDALMLFGQFVGSWDVDFVSSVPGQEGRFDAEWHFAWILQGRGVQDVWIVPKRRHGRSPDTQFEYGTTVRVYDPKINAWHVTWHGPLRSNFQNFIAQQVGDQIVLTGGKAGSLPMRWIFSEVEADRFNWRAEVSPDGGSSWIVVQTMHAERTR